MRVVIDGLPIRGMSLGIVVEELLKGWDQLATDDEIHLVIGPESDIEVPSSVIVHHVRAGRRHFVSRIQAQTLTIPKLCRAIGADVLLGVIPTTTISPLPCPRVIMAYDLRHELRPEQFSTQARILRTVSYGLGYRQSDAIACISERTRQDLFAAHPWLRNRIVRVTHLGADHVSRWPKNGGGHDYALAFGQYGNKNVNLVVDAWSLLHEQGDAPPLVVTGLSPISRAEVQAKVERLGLSEVVTVLPWLPSAEFHAQFSSASLVVFPSDFEGFGLPAVEAMRLGIPVVITPDPALLEVTGGHATVVDGPGPEALAQAVSTARRRTPGDLAAAKAHGEEFTWSRTATQMRSMLREVLDGVDHKTRAHE
jgi:glycosyltransferase involved in cell wall biosynthesis